MYKRNDIMEFLNNLVDNLQSKVYGKVCIMESMMIESYRICIVDRDIKCVFDLTDKVHYVNTETDAERLEYEIMQQYKEYILGAYIVGN